MKFFKRKKTKNSPPEQAEQPAPLAASPGAEPVLQPPLQEVEPAPIEGSVVEQTALEPAPVEVPKIQKVEQ